MMPNNLYAEQGPYGSVLVRPVTPEANLITYQLTILMRRRPCYLLSGYVRYRGGVPEYCSITTGKKPVDESLEQHERCMETGRPLLAEIVADVVDALDHLLPLDQLALHPSLIFLDPNRRPYLICWPMRERTAADAPAPSLSAPAGDRSDVLQELLGIWCQSFQFPQPETNACHQALQDHGPEGLLLHLTHEPVLSGSSSAILGLDDPGDCSSSEESILPAGEPANPAQSPRSFIRNKWMILLFAHMLAATVVLIGRLTGHLADHPLFRPLALVISVILILADLTAFIRLFRNRTHATKTVKPADKVRSFLSQLAVADPAPEGSAEGQTLLLSANPADFRMAMLAEGKPGTPEENEGLRAFILVDEFIIGRDPRNADLVVDDPGVGRIHARIIRRTGSFFICDLGSKNGTCLDGRKLMRNTEDLLPDRCFLQFANRAFYFQAD